MTNAKPQREAPWAIRGVSAEAKSAAAMAAKALEQPIGAWLDRVVRDAASAQLSSKGRQEIGPTQEQMLKKMMEEIERVNQRLDQADQAKNQTIENPHKSGLLGRARWLLTGKTT